MPMANQKQLDARSSVLCAGCHVLSDCICESATWRLDEIEAAKRNLINSKRRLARARKRAVPIRLEQLEKWATVMTSGWVP